MRSEVFIAFARRASSQCIRHSKISAYLSYVLVVLGRKFPPAYNFLWRTVVEDSEGYPNKEPSSFGDDTHFLLLWNCEEKIAPTFPAAIGGNSFRHTVLRPVPTWIKSVRGRCSS